MKHVKIDTIASVIFSRVRPIKKIKKYLPDDTSKERPSADALFITERDRCFAPVGKPGTGGVFNGDDSVS